MHGWHVTKTSGIESAAKTAGARIAFGHDEKYYKSVTIPDGIRLKETKIHEEILNCDVWINVPILKNHGGDQNDHKHEVILWVLCGTGDTGMPMICNNV